MKILDIFDWVAEFVDDHELKDGEEILISLDGRNLCKAIAQIEEDAIGFRVISLR